MAISTWISINLLCINSTIRCCYEKKKVNLDCIKVFQGITNKYNCKKYIYIYQFPDSIIQIIPVCTW